MKQLYFLIFSLFISGLAFGQLNGTKTIGAGGDYLTLTSAISALNSSGMDGTTILELQNDYSSSGESFPIVIGSTISGLSQSNTLTIRPASGVTQTISGSVDGNTIFVLDGSTYVNIDGRSGGIGTAKSLTITNTSTNSSAGTGSISFINGAMNNNINYLNVLSASTNNSATAGSIIFGTTVGINGNSNNTISNCYLGPVNSDQTRYGIICNGTAGTPNASNNILNNEFRNMVFRGISLATGLGNNWSISGNRFYYTGGGSFGSTRPIFMSNSTSSGHTISNNIIGGNDSNGNGLWAWSSGSATLWYGMELSLGTANTTNISGNIIRNVSIQNTATSYSLVGILCTSGAFNISDNTISNLNLTSTQTGTSAILAGAYFQTSTSGLTYTFNNNILTNFTNSSANQAAIYGLNVLITASSVALSNSITGNTMSGFLLSANSTTSTDLIGIQVSNASSPTSHSSNGDISNNTIFNLVNNGIGTSSIVRGIIHGNPYQTTLNINNNNIYSLTSTGANTTSTSIASISGISNTSSGGGILNINNNTIHTLINNTNASTSIHIIGIGVFSSSSQASNIGRNRIYGFSFPNTTSITNTISGITLRSTNVFNVMNNMISLGNEVNNNVAIYGIHNNSLSSQINAFYNSVVIAGSSSGSNSSAAIFRNAVASPILMNNNIVHNERTGGAGKHYAIMNTNTSASTGWGTSSSNNNLFSSNDVTLGLWGTGTDRTFSEWQSSSGGENNSINRQSVFLNLSTADLRLNTSLNCFNDASGIPIPGVTIDYYNNIRSSGTPDIGAVEFVNILAGPITDSQQVGAKVSDLVPQGANINWYTAEFGGSPLNLNAAIQEGNTYYVTQTINGCESIRTPVLIVASLGVNEFDLKSFKYYPNPVNDILNLSYSVEISTVEVFNYSGKKVKLLTPKSTNVKLDMNDLSTGIYVLKLTSEGKTHVVRIVKK